MRWRDLFKLLVVLLLFGYASAQSTTDASSTTGTATLTTSSPTQPEDSESTATTSSTSTRRGPTIITTACCVPTRNQTLPHTTRSRTTPGRPHTPRPDRPRPTFSTPPPDASTQKRSGQSPTQILFEVLGAVAGLVVLLGLVRCIYKYKRTPNHDRIRDLLDRHNLERELREMEEAQAREEIVRARRPSLVRPPPPYQGAPDYEEAIRSSQISSPGTQS